jgi:hypothetical protein
MRIKSFFFVFSVLALLCFSGCKPDYSIFVSTQDLNFGLEAETQTMIVRANCKWTITKNDDADWYSISPMSGRANDSIITVTVNDYSNGDYRGSSFVISSPGGHIRRTVFVSQNKMDFYGMINKVYGVMRVEHWNTDYYGMIIEDGYEDYTYDPYDTTSGYLMYFLDEGRGYQRDHHTDTVAWWSFDYEFNADSNILHIKFHLVNDSLESYDPTVLCASDSLYRVLHQYKPNFWERADMRKVGTITPEEKSLLLTRYAKSRKGRNGIFQF